MPLWGNKNQPVSANLTTTHESTEGAPIGTYVHVKGDQIDRKGGANAHVGNTVPGSRARVDFDMFESSIFNEFMPRMAVGVFGVYANSGDLGSGRNKDYHDRVNRLYARSKVGDGPDGEQLKYKLIDPGCGYSGGVSRRPVPIRLYYANGYVDSTSAHGDIYINTRIDPPDPMNGKIAGITVDQEQFVDEPPNADIDPPEDFLIDMNKTQLDPRGFAINSAQWNFGKGDKIYYYVPQGNTPCAPLTGNTYYYIANVDMTFIQFSETANGDPIILTDPRINSDDPVPEQHSVQGRQALVEAYIETSNTIGASHAGWVLRKEFRGGRDGRVQTECLVAMSSLQEGVIPPGEPEPVVYDIDPDFGTEFGGNTVRINGEHFISFEPDEVTEDSLGNTYLTRVLFGNVFASNVNVVNNTYLECVSPPSPKPQTIDVRVQTGFGISRVSPNTKFTYTITEPYVKKVTPNRGGYKGQTNVIIAGYNFGSTTSVKFGNIDALSFDVMSNEYISAVSPPAPNGTINIFVTGANGTSDPDPTSEFTYYSAIPTVANLQPKRGNMDPTVCTINGSNFIQYGAKYKGDTPELKVYFGQYEAQITTIVSDTQIIVDPPQVSIPGPVNVIVRNIYGNSIPDANSVFTYYADPPSVTNANPKYVSSFVPTDVTITGNNLWLAEAVRYGAFFVRDNLRVSADGKSLVFTTVASGDTNDYMVIEVDTPSGTTPRYYDCGISYVNFPFVSDMTLHAYDYRGNVDITVSGINFNNPVMNVNSIYFMRDDTYFGTKYYVNNATVSIANNTSLKFRLPNMYNLGADIFKTYNTILTSNTGRTSTNTAGCKLYIDNWTPVVDRTDPKIGPVKGFTEIYCYGKNYSQTTMVSAQLGEGSMAPKCKSVRVVNDSIMIAVSPTMDISANDQNYPVIVNSDKFGQSGYGGTNNLFTYTNNSGTLASLKVNYPGCGYPTTRPIKVTARLFSNGMSDNRAGVCTIGEVGANAGRITSVVANNDFPILFRGFDSNPTMEIDFPENYSFAANTSGFSGYPASTRAFALYGADKIFQNGDKVYYTCQGPGGPLKPLSQNRFYYITRVASGWPQGSFQLAETKADALANVAINIYDTRLNNQGPTNDISFVQGEQANCTYTLVP